jgi:hypothetical protein
MPYVLNFHHHKSRLFAPRRPDERMLVAVTMSEPTGLDVRWLPCGQLLLGGPTSLEMGPSQTPTIHYTTIYICSVFGTNPRCGTLFRCVEILFERILPSSATVIECSCVSKLSTLLNMMYSVRSHSEIKRTK